MHEDLRRRALESKKTVSKKSQTKSNPSSKQSSRPASNTNSRSASRIASRNVSDDEDERSGNLSDDTAQSINSIDALLESDEFNEHVPGLSKELLGETVEELLEHKGSSKRSREEALISYDRILTQHHYGDVLYGKVGELLKVFSWIIKNEKTPREATLALRAVALTAISFETSSLYEVMGDRIKKAITDSQDNSVKAAAIQCLGICLTFGGAGEEDITDTLTFLLEVVQSDGGFVGADDNAEVVAAALQTYAFLATQVDDLEDESEDAVEAFMEQLDSGDVSVQIAAGEAIALLFEKSYTPREDDETASDLGDANEDGDSDSSSDGMKSPDRAGDRNLVRRYNAYHNASEVLEKVNGLANLSSKGMNRHDKKKLHQSFSSISMTVENPRVGLQTNNSSKATVRIHREGEIKVDKWWKMMRLAALRRLLVGGFINHYFEGNKLVLDILPVIVRSTGMSGSGTLSPRGTPKKSKGGDKFRDTRRFISADGD